MPPLNSKVKLIDFNKTGRVIGFGFMVDPVNSKKTQQQCIVKLDEGLYSLDGIMYIGAISVYMHSIEVIVE